jgi:hypothetical protein
MPNDLAKVAAASPENIEIPGEGITSKTLLHLQGHQSDTRLTMQRAFFRPSPT